MFRDDEDGFLFGVLDANHADHFIVFSVESHGAHASCHAAHDADVALMETDGATVAVGDDHFVVSIGEAHLDHAVAFAQGDGVHAVLARAGIGL